MCLDGDPADIYAERLRRARRRYECEECGGPIPAGVKYIHVTCLSEGSWSYGRQHVECCEIWQFVQIVLCGSEGLRYVGGLRDELREYDDASERWDDEGNRLPAAHGSLESLLDECADGYRALELGNHA